MNARSLKFAIQLKVTVSGRPYSEWVVGVTDDPARRRRQHRKKGHDVSLWQEWDADTEKAARDTEIYFQDKGMKGGPGGQGNADSVVENVLVT